MSKLIAVSALAAGAAATATGVLTLGGAAQAATPITAATLHRADVVRALGGSAKGGPDNAVGVSACTGELRWATAVGHRTGNAHAWFTGRDRTRQSFELAQSVAAQPTLANARRTYHHLVRLVADCRHEPAGHWRYGAPRHPAVAGGAATWMPTTDGDGTPDGGVIVVRVGRRVGLAEIFDPGVRAADVRALITPMARRLR